MVNHYSSHQVKNASLWVQMGEVVVVNSRDCCGDYRHWFARFWLSEIGTLGGCGQAVKMYKHYILRLSKGL